MIQLTTGNESQPQTTTDNGSRQQQQQMRANSTDTADEDIIIEENSEDGISEADITINQNMEINLQTQLRDSLSD